MNEMNCGSVCIAALAIADGEKPLLTADQVEAHLLSCASCRLEVEHLLDMARLLDTQKRREQPEDVWPLVERRLKVMKGEARLGPRPLLYLGSILLLYKVILMVAQHDLGLWFKLLPVLFVVAFFSYFRENPFKINCEFKLEGE